MPSVKTKRLRREPVFAPKNGVSKTARMVMPVVGRKQLVSVGLWCVLVLWQPIAELKNTNRLSVFRR
jgi:hypothetical protein